MSHEQNENELETLRKRQGEASLPLSSMVLCSCSLSPVSDQVSGALGSSRSRSGAWLLRPAWAVAPVCPSQLGSVL